MSVCVCVYILNALICSTRKWHEHFCPIGGHREYNRKVIRRDACVCTLGDVDMWVACLRVCAQSIDAMRGHTVMFTPHAREHTHHTCSSHAHSCDIASLVLVRCDTAQIIYI